VEALSIEKKIREGVEQILRLMGDWGKDSATEQGEARMSPPLGGNVTLQYKR
jgi:hypothetical protein